MTKPSTSSASDEALIINRQYLTASGEVCDSLISPSEETVNVTTTILTTFDRLFLKNLSLVGLRNKIEKKCRQLIFKGCNNWMKCGSDCYEHRMFFIKKIVTTKLYWKLKEISKDLRQPGGKHGGFLQKANILKGN